MKECPFCKPADRVIDKEGPCVAIADGYPVSEGHALVIPVRHIASFEEMTVEEWAAASVLIKRRIAHLRKADASIAGFNVGINDGEAAGQTIPHAHIHVIPRRAGDVPNPRGGVRHVIPCKGDYPAQV